MNIDTFEKIVINSNVTNADIVSAKFEFRLTAGNYSLIRQKARHINFDSMQDIEDMYPYELNKLELLSKLINSSKDNSRSLETFTSLSHIRACGIYNHSSSLLWEYFKDVECLLQMENDALKMEEMKMEIEYTADKMKGRGARWDI